MTIFTSISQGKIKIVTCFTRQKKLYSLFFTAHEARYDFEFSLGSASENGYNTPKARYDCGPRYWKCQISLSQPETVENSEDLTRLPKSRLLLLGNEQGSRTETRAPEPRLLLSLWGQGSWTETKVPKSRFLLFFTLRDFRIRCCYMDDVHRTTQKMPHFAVNHAWDQK